VHEGETVIVRQIDRMGVRALLALRIGPMTGVLHESRSLAQSAVFEHRKRGHAAAGVVCHEYILSSFVHGNVTGVRSPGRNLVQESQFAGCAIDDEGTYRSALF